MLALALAGVSVASCPPGGHNRPGKGKHRANRGLDRRDRGVRRRQIGAGRGCRLDPGERGVVLRHLALQNYRICGATKLASLSAPALVKWTPSSARKRTT